MLGAETGASKSALEWILLHFKCVCVAVAILFSPFASLTVSLHVICSNSLTHHSILMSVPFFIVSTPVQILSILLQKLRRNPFPILSSLYLLSTLSTQLLFPWTLAACPLGHLIMKCWVGFILCLHNILASGCSSIISSCYVACWVARHFTAAWKELEGMPEVVLGRCDSHLCKSLFFLISLMKVKLGSPAACYCDGCLYLTSTVSLDVNNGQKDLQWLHVLHILFCCCLMIKIQ